LGKNSKKGDRGCTSGSQKEGKRPKMTQILPGEKKEHYQRGVFVEMAMRWGKGREKRDEVAEKIKCNEPGGICRKKSKNLRVTKEGRLDSGGGKRNLEPGRGPRGRWMKRKGLMEAGGESKL